MPSFLPLLRSLARPCFGWWLALPVLFWHTRRYCLSLPAARLPYTLFNDGGARTSDQWWRLAALRRLPQYINHYRVFGLNVSAHAYDLVEDAMLALLLVVFVIYAHKYLWPRFLCWNP